MYFNVKKNEITAIAILIGATIGAGIFGLPYVAAKAGLLNTVIMTVVLALAVLFLNLYIGEITLRTKDRHELSGYVGMYWGKFGKTFMTLAVGIWVLGALTAYTLGVGAALHAIFPTVLASTFSMIFYLLMSTLLFFGLRTVAKSELILGSLMLFFILTILGWSSSNISPDYLSFGALTIGGLFFPVGVILFAMMSEVVIPELKPILNNPKKLKKVIIIGTLVPAVIYLLFAVIVTGVVGLEHFEALSPNDRVATVPLGQTLGRGMSVFANIFAVLAMSTSFLALGLGLIWTLRYDYSVKKSLAWTLSVLVPILMIVSGKANFISAMDFAGSIAGGISGIILVITFHMARKKFPIKKPAYVLKHTGLISAFLIGVFALAIIKELIGILI